MLKKNEHLPVSSQSIKSEYDHHKNIPNEANIKSEFNSSKRQVLNQANEKNLKSDFTVDESPKENANKIIQSNMRNIQHGQQHIQEESQKRTDKINQEKTHHAERHGTLLGDFFLRKGIDTKE